jgi:predicted amidohydrolase
MMVTMTKFAAAQIEPKLMKISENLEGILNVTKEAAGNGADLIVFPECSLTGYIFLGREEALSFAESIPGLSTRPIKGEEKREK